MSVHALQKSDSFHLKDPLAKEFGVLVAQKLARYFPFLIALKLLKIVWLIPVFVFICFAYLKGHMFIFNEM